MVVFLSRFLCGCCSVLAVMFVTAVIASRGGKGKSYCCILTSLILVLEVAVESCWECVGVFAPCAGTCVRFAHSDEAEGATNLLG